MVVAGAPCSSCSGRWCSRSSLSVAPARRRRRGGRGRSGRGSEAPSNFGSASTAARAFHFSARLAERRRSAARCPGPKSTVTPLSLLDRCAVDLAGELLRRRAEDLRDARARHRRRSTRAGAVAGCRRHRSPGRHRGRARCGRATTPSPATTTPCRLDIADGLADVDVDAAACAGSRWRSAMPETERVVGDGGAQAGRRRGAACSGPSAAARRARVDLGRLLGAGDLDRLHLDERRGPEPEHVGGGEGDERSAPRAISRRRTVRHGGRLKPDPGAARARGQARCAGPRQRGSDLGSAPISRAPSRGPLELAEQLTLGLEQRRRSARRRAASRQPSARGCRPSSPSPRSRRRPPRREAGRHHRRARGRHRRSIVARSPSSFNAKPRKPASDTNRFDPEPTTPTLSLRLANPRLDRASTELARRP